MRRSHRTEPTQCTSEYRCWSGKGLVQNGGCDTVDPTLPKLHRQILPWDTRNLWDFSRWTPDVVVIDLGTNDYNVVAPDSARFVKAYVAFLDSLLAKYPATRFVVVEGPMMSDNYPAGMNALTRIRRNLDAVVAIAATRGVQATHLSLTPQGNLGYGADWHPNRKQATLNGQELTAHLRTVTGWTGSSGASGSTSPPVAHLRRSPRGYSVVVPSGPTVRARLLDAKGRTLWTAVLGGGSTTPLPRTKAWRMLEVESAQGLDSFPLPGP